METPLGISTAAAEYLTRSNTLRGSEGARLGDESEVPETGEIEGFKNVQGAAAWNLH